MESGADHDVGVRQSVEHAIEIGRVVLAIGIDLHEGAIAAPLRMQEGGAHGAADPDIEGQ